MCNREHEQRIFSMRKHDDFDVQPVFSKWRKNATKSRKLVSIFSKSQKPSQMWNWLPCACNVPLCVCLCVWHTRMRVPQAPTSILMCCRCMPQCVKFFRCRFSLSLLLLKSIKFYINSVNATSFIVNIIIMWNRLQRWECVITYAINVIFSKLLQYPKPIYINV